MNKPHRIIPVGPIISPFDSGEDKVPREDSQIPHWSLEHPSTPDLVPKDTPQSSPVNTPMPTPSDSLKTPRSPVTSRRPTPCQDFVSSHDPICSDSGPTLMVTTKDLVDALTMTLKNINQSPTIPLPVFKGKKGEDQEDQLHS